MKKRIYLEDTHSTIYYMPATGRFYRVNPRTGKATRTGVSKHTGGYRTMRFRGKTRYSHRVAFFAVTGRWPRRGKYIDHVNGVKHDNSWINIREGTPAENARNRQRANKNSRTGHRGVVKRDGRFCAYIHVDGRQKWLGTYPTLIEAVHHYERAAAVYHGIFNKSGIKAVLAA